MKEIKNIVLIGAGNVATRLGLAFQKADLKVVQVYSRSTSSAKALGNVLGTDFTTDLTAISRNADLYILSVADDALQEVLGELEPGNSFLVHTSGSQPMAVLLEHAKNYGVFYPLQTFSKNRPVDFRKIPVCLEANNSRGLDQLKSLAGKISDVVLDVPSSQRRNLHLAAVFACNFPNFMYEIAALIVNKSGLDFNLLKPLILETAEKVQEVSPSEAQTGPALRGDKRVLEMHLAMLNEMPEFQAIYKKISEGITTKHEQ